MRVTPSGENTGLSVEPKKPITSEKEFRTRYGGALVIIGRSPEPLPLEEIFVMEEDACTSESPRRHDPAVRLPWLAELVGREGLDPVDQHLLPPPQEG